MADQQPLGKAVAGEGFELKRVSNLTDSEDADVRIAVASRSDHLGRMLGIGVDDGGSVRRQQLGEEAQLGGEIGLHAGVIVEMVAAQIGEGRSLQPDAVEPVLIEPVRGSLEGEVRDALGCQLPQGPMQGDGIGRGETAVDAAVGLDETDGAERGGLAAEVGEDLAREVGDRGLAAGAGNGDDGVGLGRVEARRHPGQRLARLGGSEHGDPGRRGDLRPLFDENGGGAPRDRLRDEARPVRLAAGHGSEQPARPHLAAVGRDAGDLGGAACRPRRHLRTEQGFELHGSQRSPPSPWLP
jgi:hypothetical protein